MVAKIRKVSQTKEAMAFEGKRPYDKLKYLILFLILFIGPQVFLWDHYDFANLPQQAFIHILSTFFLAYVILSYRRKEGFRLVLSEYYIPIFGFLTWASISISYAHNKYEGIYTILMWIGPATLFLALTNAQLDRRDISWILNLVFGSGVLSAVIGSLQYLVKFPLIPQVVEPAATFANKNMAAHIMVLNIPLGIALLLSSGSGIRAFCYAVGTSLMITFLYYTKTKAAWLAFMVEFILLMLYVLFLRPKFNLDAKKKVALLVGVIIVGVLINLSPHGWAPAFQEISQKAELVKEAVAGREEAEEAAYGSVGLRIAIFRNTLEMIKDRPLLGFGLGNHKVYYPIYHRKVVIEKVFSEEAQLHNVHNDFLQLFSETGVIGFSLLALLFLLWMRSVKRVSIDRRGDESALWAMGIFIGILGIMINGSFCFPSFRAVPPMIVMTFTSILFSMEQMASERSQRTINIRRPLNLFLSGLFVALSVYLCYYYGRLLISDKYYLLISRYESKKNWNGILSIGPKELELEPHRAKIRSYMGRAYIEVGRCREGAEELEKVLEYYPYHMNALLNLGVAYSCMGEYQRSLETYQRVLSIKPDYAKVYNNIAHIYLKLGDRKKAIESLNEAIKLNQGDANILVNLGVIYLSDGELYSAVNLLERAVALKPKWTVPYRHLGMVYLKVGQINKAKELWEKALKLAPKGDPVAQEIAKLLEELKKGESGG